MKYDSGSCAVFTEQGSSASHMFAAKLLDVLSRLPDFAGEASDGISAYTKVKNGGRSKIDEKSHVRMSRILDTSPTTQMAKDAVVPLKRNRYGHPLAGLLSRGQFEEVLLGPGWEKYRIGKGNFTYRHHVEPRVKLYVPREESFPTPLRYCDDKFDLGCDA